jgi:hypothetical protein
MKHFVSYVYTYSGPYANSQRFIGYGHGVFILTAPICGKAQLDYLAARIAESLDADHGLPMPKVSILNFSLLPDDPDTCGDTSQGTHIC